MSKSSNTTGDISHPSIKDGWFQEINSMWPGQALMLKVDRVMYHEKSAYQDILVFQSEKHGRVLVLDNVIQCTEFDEYSYQEMITHLPLNSHKNPKKVLVIGGGDGGVLREVEKHSCVESVTLCEIDEGVINVSKKYFPDMAIGFEDPRVTVHIGDGFQFLKDHKNEFDVIITDSSDPEGPAESLFQPDYYMLLNDALKADGVSIIQAESMWLHLDLIRKLNTICKGIFPSVAYAYATVPTYPSGQIGFMLCSKTPAHDLSTPFRRIPREEELKLNRYYGADIHKSAFNLPNFVYNRLNS